MDFEIVNGQTCLKKLKDGEYTYIPVDVYSGVDPASSLAATADFFVIATIAVDKDMNKYVVDIFRKRLSPAEQPGIIIDTYKKFKPRRMKIETVGYQEALRTACREIMHKEGLYIPGLEKGVKPRTRKSERLLSLVPMFAKGSFFFRSEDLEAQKEFLSYPRGKHDDVMDAVWTALDGHRPCRVKNFDASDKNNTKSIKKIDWLTI
jgi:predicted phage terminase large subunit-like protein